MLFQNQFNIQQLNTKRMAVKLFSFVKADDNKLCIVLLTIQLQWVIARCINNIMREEKLLEGLKVLLAGTGEYQFKFSSTLNYRCSIKQILQKELEIRYPQITLQFILNEFSQYLALPTELLGKRSSQIIISTNRILCCKILDQQSFHKLMEIKQDLWKYIDSFPDTYLTEIYRIFVIQSFKDNFKQTDYFIFMPCLRPQFQQIIAMYDLKGYTEGRNLGLEDFKIFKFGKDQNFIHSKQLPLVLKLQKAPLINFLKIFARDVKFLQSKNIIDYSLLISFRTKDENIAKTHKNSISIGENIVMQWTIIDYFQEYNSKKKAQNKFKLIFKKQVSSVEPSLYAERFIKFIIKYFQLS